MHAMRARFARLTFLVLAVVLTTFAMIPVQSAEAAGCGAWTYNGCCGARLSQYRQCCDDFGNCRLETRCSTYTCYF
jgi:hypothetical protein